MFRTSTLYPAPGILSLVIVIAVSAITVIAIAAWLVHQVARRAIDKTTPEEVAPVILALATWLDPLRLFLPWSRVGKRHRPPPYPDDLPQAPLHNETSPKLPQEAGNEA